MVARENMPKGRTKSTLQAASSSGVERISMSLDPKVLKRLDAFKLKKGYANRSLALSDIIRKATLANENIAKTDLVAGNISLVYNESKNDIQGKLAKIQRRYVDAIISNLSVLLENNYRLEVWIAQGPFGYLNDVIKKVSGLKGIESCQAVWSQEILPPIHKRK